MASGGNGEHGAAVPREEGEGDDAQGVGRGKEALQEGDERRRRGLGLKEKGLGLLASEGVRQGLWDKEGAL